MLTSDEASRLLQLAQSAHARGDGILHLQVNVSVLTGASSSWGSAGNSLSNDDNLGYFLSDVERHGWSLQHTGYTFVESGATTSARVFGTGEGVVNHGAVIGYFTFRRTD